MRTATNAAIYRPDLGIVVMEYVEQAAMGYIGLEVMPIFRTALQSSSFPVIPKEVLLKLPDVSRAPRGRYGRGDWEYERGLYTTKEKGWEEPIDDSERALFSQEAPGMADIIATKRGMNHIMRGQEKRIADTIFNAGNFTAHAVVNEWDDSANATPITDVNTGVLAFRSQCGMLPDALIIAYSTFVNLKSCAQIVDRIKYTFPGIDINKMTSSQLAAVFNVPQVLIGGAVYDSAGKGLASSISDVWYNEYAALVKISRGQDIMEPGVGRTFLWTADSPENPIVESYREDQTRSDIFRVRHNVDEALMRSYNDAGAVVSDIAAACVYLFSNVTTI
jgi:hypothetical protein